MHKKQDAWKVLCIHREWCIIEVGDVRLLFANKGTLEGKESQDPISSEEERMRIQQLYVLH